MRQLDVLIVHPNASAEIYQELSKEHSAIETPIWAGMLAQHCRINDFGVQILDCEVERLNYIESAKIVKEANPRLACLTAYGAQPSASSQSMEGAVALAQEIKKLNPEIKIMFIGGHVAALPLEVLSHPEVDFVAINEGVYALRDLLSCDDLGDKSLLRRVKGIGWKDEGIAQLNPANSIVPQNRLSQDLPGVAWDLLPPPNKYRTAGWHSWPNNSVKSPFASLYTSLGCPFKCSFCMINSINRQDVDPNYASDKSAVFRYWEPSFIVKQFEKLAEMGVINVKIADELFVLREQHFMEICKLLIERKLGQNYWCYSRVDTCKPHYLENLKKAGVNFVGLGIESPNQVVRKDVIKGGYKEVKIIEVIKMFRNAGIGVGSNVIYGLPEDNLETMKETFDFVMDACTENCNMYCAMCYPGSPLYLHAKSKGWQLPDRYAGYSQHSYWTQNLPTNYISAAEVLKFRDEAWMKYFTNERYLDMLESKYGKPAREDVESSTKIKLKRRLLGDKIDE
jgi:radical SAM superfamily enzyme YgiQ (UPF0313 family)